MLSAWSAEGFSDDRFWQQTAETYEAIMQGRRLLRENEAEMLIAGAWWQARFAREETLHPVSHYLAKKVPPTLEEQLAQWDALASSGYGVTITDMTVN